MRVPGTNHGCLFWKGCKNMRPIKSLAAHSKIQPPGGNTCRSWTTRSGSCAEIPATRFYIAVWPHPESESFPKKLLPGRGTCGGAEFAVDLEYRPHFRKGVTSAPGLVRTSVRVKFNLGCLTVSSS